MENLDIYVPVAIFLIFGFVMPIASMFIVKQISPRSRSMTKLTTYESGSVPTGNARIMFNVEYYFFAIVFVLFDVEVLFLYPWVTVYVNEAVERYVVDFTTGLALFEMFLFLVIVFLGYIYAWKKGALQWIK